MLLELSWVGILEIAISALVSSVIALLISAARSGGKKYWESHKEEQKAEIKQVVEEVIQPIYRDIETLNKKVDDIQQNDLTSLKKASRDSIRYQLYAIYDRCDVQGYRTSHDSEIENELFNSYKALNGNHGCEARHEAFQKLAIKSKIN